MLSLFEILKSDALKIAEHCFEVIVLIVNLYET